jgi:hypothetical protein
MPDAASPTAPQQPLDASAPKSVGKPASPLADAAKALQEPGKGKDEALAKPDEHGRTEHDLAKGYRRPYRDAVVHAQCGIVTVLAPDVAAEMARNPGVLGVLRCPHCRARRPVAEFLWHGTTKTVNVEGKDEDGKPVTLGTKLEGLVVGA